MDRDRGHHNNWTIETQPKDPSAAMSFYEPNEHEAQHQIDYILVHHQHFVCHLLPNRLKENIYKLIEFILMILDKMA